ncbi:hypothetical protein U3516DRAFT_571036 [Neocallimastix sp. 'constans']
MSSNREGRKIPLPIIGGNNKNVKAWYILMKNWLKMEKVTDDEEKFQFILAGTVEEATQIVSDKFVEANRILNLEECRDILLERYHLNEDERFRELKTLLIMPNESVREFNDRYLDYYCQLSTDNKAKLSVYDYENSIRSRTDIYEKVAYEEAKTIEAACKIAEKVERIKLGSRSVQKGRKFNNNNIQNNYPFISRYRSNQNFNQLNNNYNSFLNTNLQNKNRNLNNELQRSNNFNNNYNNYNNINNNTLNRMNNTKVPRNINNTPNNNNGLNSVDDITRGLENLHIKVCYWCHEPGHIIRYCPQLRYQQNNNQNTKN